MRGIVRFLLAVIAAITAAVGVTQSPLGIAVWEMLRLIDIVSYADCNDNWGVHADTVANAACAPPTSRLVVSLATTVLASFGVGALVYSLTGRIQRRKAIAQGDLSPRG